MSIKGFQIGNGTVQKYDYESLDNLPESFVEIDDTLTEEGQAADAKATGDALSDLSSAISDMNTATSEDEGKALKAKTVSGGKVTEWEFGEAGGADPEVIEQAVEDWLDDHPDATTTVEDGSLTDAKFTEATLALLQNNYVTPEMYGAVGDGVTDDADAINDMFASNNTVFVFGNKTYLTNAAVTCNKTCTIFFDHTTIQAKKSYGLRDFEYVIGFTAPRIKTFGSLQVLAATSVNIGIWLATIGGSHFDRLSVNNARIWGLYIDSSTNGNNSLTINTLSAAQCGFKAHAKARRVDNNTLEITNITGSFTGYNDSIRAGLFDNSYGHANLVIDDSLYMDTSNYQYSRFVFYHNGDTAGFTLNEEDISKATFNVNSTGPKVPNNYTQNDEVRDVYIPIGGGVRLCSKNSEGVYIIHSLITQSNPLSSYISLGYGGTIGSYSSEYDTVVMHNESLVTRIGYTYFEAVGNGYSNMFDNELDRIYVFTQTTNIRIIIDNPFIGASRFPFATGNIVINYKQNNYEVDPMDKYVCCPGFLARKMSGINGYSNGTGGVQVAEVDEYIPRNITLDCYGVTATSKINLSLRELNNSNKTNGFEPLTFYIRRRRENSDYDAFTITMKNDLVNAGYSINGAVDNVLIIKPSDYNNFVKVTIMLFRSDKTFFVTAEPMTFVSNVQT